MADRALTEDAMLAGLHDIHLPADAAGGALAEILMATALGLVVAGILTLLLHLFFEKAPVASPKTTRDQLDDLSLLPEEQRQLALLRLLKRTRPKAFQRFAHHLYQPDGLPDLTLLETEVARHD